MTAAPTASEHQIHMAVAQWLDLAAKRAGFWWCHAPNEGVRPPAMGAKLKALGMRPGCPDILIIHQGRAYWIELKTVTGRVSAAQKDTAAALVASGSPVALCRSLDDVIRQLQAWGIVE